MDESWCDFPAAHSMDTAWFAVDLDGHVAVFETGEAGALPKGAACEDPYQLKTALRERLAPTEPIFDVDGRRVPVPLHASALLFDRPGPHALLIFLGPGGGSLLAGLECTQVEATRGEAFRVADLPKGRFEELHASGACTACEVLWQTEEEGSLSGWGLFEYRHDDYQGTAGPYRLQERPKAPVKLEAVPPNVAEVAIRFEGRFAESASINPPELWECEGWSASWVASDGKTVRPFADRLADYAGEREGAAAEEELVFLDEPLARPAAQPAAPPPPKPWWRIW
jgi:hypothetical protein